ncbi:hypothetical protein EYF80_004043 [Liparis tanakae]|uniref:Uncharacterized protein n=1 Tax=Liparis tanakae TaxID=230148 RepID=A0A4Z2J6J1_9TELE|nr:hypothetical protein EYF80_004043 [Liparis tanakae]
MEKMTLMQQAIRGKLRQHQENTEVTYRNRRVKNAFQQHDSAAGTLPWDQGLTKPPLHDVSRRLVGEDGASALSIHHASIQLSPLQCHSDILATQASH